MLLMLCFGVFFLHFFKCNKIDELSEHIRNKSQKLHSGGEKGDVRIRITLFFRKLLLIHSFLNFIIILV